jgi:hypothetical protein
MDDSARVGAKIGAISTLVIIIASINCVPEWVQVSALLVSNRRSWRQQAASWLLQSHDSSSSVEIGFQMLVM